MTSSYTISESTTFTVTHAKHIAARVAADLKRIQRLYGAPTDSRIAAYEQELILLLKDGYLDTVFYGYRREESWIEPTLRYTARELAGDSVNSNDPGRVRPGADVSSASFFSYLTYSSKWHRANPSVREAFERQLPFPRSGAPEPAVDGYWQSDHSYTAGGRALDRSSVRSL